MADIRADEALVLLWPEGWSAHGGHGGSIVVSDDDGDRVARQGERVTFGGGQHGFRSAEELIGVGFPADCRAHADAAWLVSEVVDRG